MFYKQYEWNVPEQLCFTASKGPVKPAINDTWKWSFGTVTTARERTEVLRWRRTRFIIYSGYPDTEYGPPQWESSWPMALPRNANID